MRLVGTTITRQNALLLSARRPSCAGFSPVCCLVIFGKSLVRTFYPSANPLSCKAFSTYVRKITVFKPRPVLLERAGRSGQTIDTAFNSGGFCKSVQDITEKITKAVADHQKCVLIMRRSLTENIGHYNNSFLRYLRCSYGLASRNRS